MHLAKRTEYQNMRNCASTWLLAFLCGSFAMAQVVSADDAWTQSNCGRGQLPGDAIHSVTLVDEKWDQAAFQVSHAVDRGHVTGMDGIQRSGPIMHTNLRVVPLDANRNEIPWDNFSPGRAVDQGSGIAVSQIDLDMCHFKQQTQRHAAYLFVHFWEVGNFNGYSVCREFPFQHTFQPHPLRNCLANE